MRADCSAASPLVARAPRQTASFRVRLVRRVRFVSRVKEQKQVATHRKDTITIRMFQALFKLGCGFLKCFVVACAGDREDRPEVIGPVSVLGESIRDRPGAHGP
jgi:hypothetical protein